MDKIKKVKSYLVFLFFVCFFQIDFISTSLVWSNDILDTKEYWRVITGNFTHTNISHLALNLISFFIISFVFNPKIKEVAIILLSSSLIVGLLMFNSETVKYAGLSGILHSYFIYLCLKESLNKDYVLLMAGLIAIIKVCYEQVNGASKYTEVLINAPVAIDAHMYGAVSAFILFFLYLVLRKRNIIL